MAFIVLELLFLATAQWLGGPPWVVLGGIAVVLQACAGLRVASLALLLPAAIWLGWFHAGGNRELFFPYAMTLATASALGFRDRRWWPAAVSGGIIVAAFLAVRILQQATGRVVAVELAVAAVILAAGIATARRTRRTMTGDGAIVAAASLLAYAGLRL